MAVRRQAPQWPFVRADVMTTLVNGDESDPTIIAQRADGNIVAMPMKCQVSNRLAQAKISNCYLI